MNELPPNVIRLINSCQIITSVASVVKELIENSLDAHSTRIDIRLENSGFDKIEIRDNGSGIKQTDIQFAALPHYTSKISKEDDLKSLTTYGFRGEALGAICGVSDVIITTKTKQDDVAISHKLNHSGKIVSSKPSSYGQGTIIIVQNLFKNVPVRKQFCSNAKKKKEEIKKVEDLVIAFAIIHPDVRFTVYHNHSQIWQKISVNDVRSALLLTFGTNMASVFEYMTATDEKNQLTIEAFLPKLNLSIQQTSRLSLERSIIAVNTRPVRIKDIDRLLNKYYSHGYCIDNRWSRYPVCYISITLPSSKVDYNIEPNKSSLFFHSLESILELLKSILQNVYGDIKSDEYSDSSKFNRKNEININENTECEIIPDVIESNNNETNEVSIKRNKINEDNQEPQINEYITDDDDFQLNQKIINEKTTNNSQNNEISEPIVVEKENLVKNYESNLQDNDDQLSYNNNKSKSSDIIIEDVITTWLNNDDEFDEINKVIDLESPSLNDCNNDLPTLTNKDDSLITCKTNSLHDDKTHEERVENIIESGKNEKIGWSLGNIRNESGILIEPTRLFVPSTKKRTLEESKNHSKISNSPIKKKKNIKENFTHISVSDMFKNHKNEKSLTPYALFCREMKSEVISFNPNADSSTIDKLLMHKWAVISPEKKKEYKIRAVKENKKNDEEKNDNRNKVIDISNDDIISKKINEKNNNRPDSEILLKKNCLKFRRKEIIITINVKDLRERILSKAILNENLDNPEFDLVGQISSSGMWTVSYQDHILAVNHFRVKETVEYYRLLADYHFLLSELDCPIMLNQSSFESSEIWNTLLKLNSERNEEIGYSLITDINIIANGFEIKVYTDTAEIVRLTNCLPFYGMSDLNEILKIISKYGSTVKLEDCRPQKVMHYLQGEAVRNARITSTKLEPKEIKELLYQLKYLPAKQKSCLHKKPFFHLLYDMSEIPLSQSQS